MMHIRKAIIPAAGRGTRLYPATLEQPKEMLPVFSRGKDGSMYVKPLLQIVFEQLYEEGVREFCFVTGRAKRAIEDHFTPNNSMIDAMNDQGKEERIKEIQRFYEMVDVSTIVWINQPEPKGFGDAVYRARTFIKDEPFIVHAGDTYIATPNPNLIASLSTLHSEFHSEATFIVDEVEDPRPYGVVEGIPLRGGVYDVKRIVEKPPLPMSKLATVAVYIFTPTIFNALEKVTVDKTGEKQLTDAIQILISSGMRVIASRMKPGEIRVDIGGPQTYWEALKTSYDQASIK